MRFVEGNRVKIAKSSQFYNYTCTDIANPTCNGTILRTNDTADHSLPIYVEWDNGKTNVYAEEDLLFYDEPDVVDTSWNDLFISIGNKTVEVDDGSMYERKFKILATPKDVSPLDTLYLNDEAWVCDSHGDYICNILDAEKYAAALMAMKEYWETTHDNSFD